MSQSLPPLGWFRAFESAANHQSFTAAAKELGMTQSAVSQQIQSLESRLGCQLFERKPRGIILTDDARKLLPDIRSAIETLRSATAPYQEQQPELLTIATSVSVAQSYLAPEIKHFSTTRTHLNIRLMTTVWPDTIANSTDLQIRFGPDDGWEPLGDNRMVLVAAPSLLANYSIPLSNDELAKLSLIQPVGTSDTWATHADHFEIEANAANLLYVDSHGLAVDMAKFGSGVALTSELIAMPLLASGELVMVRPHTPKANDGYYLKLYSDSKVAIEFEQWIRKEVQFKKDQYTIASQTQNKT